MSATLDQICFIGFGEAGSAFAGAMGASGAGRPRAYDRKGLAAKQADYDHAGVEGCGDNRQAVSGAGLIVSVVTADQAVAAAQESARTIERGALYCDFNSVAPATKAEAEHAVAAAGGRYVDVAVMAPVHPLRLGVPLLVAGPDADEAVAALTALGFGDVALAGDRIGQAAAIKMIRSVMIKGIEALSAELAAAADAADVRAAVVASLDAGWNCGLGWGDRIAGAFERMERHGLRRAAEMDEVAATLAALGIDNAMARATAGKQRQVAAAAAQRGETA